MRNLSFLIILVVFSVGFAQDCNNPLLAFFNIPGLGEPQSGEGLPYCPDLRKDLTCCSPNVVAGFQDRVDALIDKINNYDAGKDLYLAQLWSRYLARFNDYLQNITQNYVDDLQAIRDANSALADQFQAHIDTSTKLSAAAQNINDDFRQTLYDYQRIRHDCYNTALQIHTSAWCLACDPNWATKGVSDDGSIIFSSGLCKTISDACWNYFSQGGQFNPLVRAREAYWELKAIADYLGNFSVTNQVTPFRPSPDPYHPLSTQLAVTVPPEWTGEGQCYDLFSGDVLLAEILAIGPTAQEAIEENVIIQEEEMIIDAADTNARLLQEVVVWVPAGLNLSGLAYDAAMYYGLSDLSDITDDTNITDLDD